MFQYFIHAYTKNYFNFSGRARRKEFWSFQLFYWLFLIVTFLPPMLTYDQHSDMSNVFMFFPVLFVLLSLIPSIAITVRRLHDRDLRGWWLLLQIIPIIGYIASFVFLVFYCLDSLPDNRFGPNPKSSLIEQ